MCGLQYVAGSAESCSLATRELQYVAVKCRELNYVAVRCSELQCVHSIGSPVIRCVWCVWCVGAWRMGVWVCGCDVGEGMCVSSHQVCAACVRCMGVWVRGYVGVLYVWVCSGVGSHPVFVACVCVMWVCGCIGVWVWVRGYVGIHQVCVACVWRVGVWMRGCVGVLVCGRDVGVGMWVCE